LEIAVKSDSITAVELNCHRRRCEPEIAHGCPTGFG